LTEKSRRSCNATAGSCDCFDRGLS
jgi:hypothetical protein